MKKIFLAMLLIAMASCLKAQNRTAVNRSSSEMVYYYSNFNVVRMKDTAKNKDVFVPSISNNTTAKMELCKDSNGQIVCFDRPSNAINWITNQGWELWMHDDHYNIIQRWFIRKKVTKQELERLIAEDLETSSSVEYIPSAVDELKALMK